MNSAAVIGRQLRQQQSSNRVLGPVVPPTQYRGRAQTNLVHNDNRNDFLPVYLGADADKKFAKFSQKYSSNSHEFYPHPAHREKNANRQSNSNKNKKKKNNITFSKHCFCVAFKALSTGVVLLVVGTVMSIIGFFADSLALEQSQLNNGTVVNTVNKGTKLHLHNMTYVGPVIMGLGGIVIIAACVLTFEVRDTLGVKNDPKKNKCNSSEKGNNSGENMISTTTNDNDNNSNKKDSFPKNHRMNLKSDSISLQPISGNDSISLNYLKSCSTNVRTDSVWIDRQYNNDNERLSNISTNSTDLSYCQIPSPVDIELSDPEGCSPNITFSKWKSRCSCSGSPTNSMLMVLHKLMDSSSSSLPNNKKNNIFFEPNQHSSKRMIASIDDLSLYSYQSEDIQCRSPQLFQDFANNHHHHNNHYQHTNDDYINRNNNIENKMFSSCGLSNHYQSSTLIVKNNNSNNEMSCSDINNKYPLLRAK